MTKNESRLGSGWRFGPALALGYLALGFSLLSGCGGEGHHEDPDREPKPWETVDFAAMDAEKAMDHFARLLEISDTAIQEGQTAELHYIELAMTETLNQIEQALGPEAAARERVAARIDSLRGLALRLHDAGHDGSVPLAANVQQAMGNAFAELKAEL